MAYTDDAVRAKLSALNETQESIVTVAQWVMFHRRHAERTGILWLQRLKDSNAGKRLNLIYLANEVAQQSKARKKEEWLVAFSPIIAEASATAYKGATNEIQQKLRRVIEVWRQRQIFESSIQEAIESRINELDKSRSSGRKPLLGGSLFSNASGSSAPTEIQPLVPLQIAVLKAVASATPTASAANSEYDKLTDLTNAALVPELQAARLNALLKSLASAEGAVSESIKARRALVEGLEKILETNHIALIREESEHSELVTRKTFIHARIREVEDGIVRNMSAKNSPKIGNAQLPFDSNGMNGNHPSSPEIESQKPERPEVEELTPPPVESLTPRRPSSPGPHYTGFPSATTANVTPKNGQHSQHPALPETNQVAVASAPAVAGSDLLSSLSMPPVRHYAGSTGSAGVGVGVGATLGGGVMKKRKLDDEFALGFGGGDDAMADLDDDVAELLRAESGGH